MGADYNVIQAPEIIRRLTQRLGLKQPHITPTLNEGVQAVVLLDDVTRTPADGAPKIFGSATDFFATPAGNIYTVQLYPGLLTPPSKSARLRRVSISMNAAGVCQVIAGRLDNNAGGSANRSVPFDGSVPPGTSEWQRETTIYSVAAWAALASSFNMFDSEFQVGDSVGGVWQYRREWRSGEGPGLPAGSVGSVLVFAVINSAGLQVTSSMEWEEF